jgi:DNA-binding NarL/FixJ family response regulator
LDPRYSIFTQADADTVNQGTPRMPLRIVVADDHGIVREGLIALLDRQEGMKVVGSAATGRAAVEATERLKPDVVIMDLAMPDWNGIEATQRILSTSPKISVIALSASHTSEHVSRALRAGARGYVVKDAKGAELVEAVKMVSVGRRYLSQRASPGPGADGLVEFPTKTPMERLSARERDVMARIIEGRTSLDIAKELSLSRKTVDTYRARLMVKLGVSNRTALIRFAIANDLIAL